MIVIGIHLISQRYMLVTTVREVETIIHKIRLRIVNKICNAELLSLEQIGRSEIYASVEKEMQTISSASMAMGMMCQSAILILFVLAYIAWMSFIALVLFVVLSTIAVGFYWFRMNELKKDIHASDRKSTRLNSSH